MDDFLTEGEIDDFLIHRDDDVVSDFNPTHAQALWEVITGKYISHLRKKFPQSAWDCLGLNPTTTYIFYPHSSDEEHRMMNYKI